MTPTDFILASLCLIVAVVALLANGPTLNGIGPALLLVGSGGWQLWMQWLRHKSWLKHRESGFAPGTGHLSLAAAIGFSAGVGLAFFWLFIVSFAAS